MISNSSHLSYLKKQERIFQDRQIKFEKVKNDLLKKTVQNSKEISKINTEIKNTELALKEIKKEQQKEYDRIKSLEAKVDSIEKINKKLLKGLEIKETKKYIEKPIAKQPFKAVPDPLSTLAISTALSAVLAKEALKKDAVKKWEKEIKKKEKIINKKFDNELKNTEKSLKKQLEHIKKKQEKDLAKAKAKELIETIKKVKQDVQKQRESELKKITLEKGKLKDAIDKTKQMKEKERQKEIERLRLKEKERQQEIERLKQLERMKTRSL